VGERGVSGGGLRVLPFCVLDKIDYLPSSPECLTLAHPESFGWAQDKLRRATSKAKDTKDAQRHANNEIDKPTLAGFASTTLRSARAGRAQLVV
jgi:hypothetical protein